MLDRRREAMLRVSSYATFRGEATVRSVLLFLLSVSGAGDLFKDRQRPISRTFDQNGTNAQEL